LRAEEADSKACVKQDRKAVKIGFLLSAGSAPFLTASAGGSHARSSPPGGRPSA
jgi:hypothetical protein